MAVAKVGRRGQLVLPVDVRRNLEIEEGDRIVFLVEDGQAVVLPLKSTLREMRGTIEVEGPQDFPKVRRVTLRGRAGREASE